MKPESTPARMPALRVPRASSSPDGRIDEASLIGMHIGDRFRLQELIGEGGMGGVFRAQQLATGRTVAVKLLHPELAHIEYVKRRFECEARAASRLSHPNIVEVLDCGESNGHLYIAMELVAGRSLADLIARDDLGAAGASAFDRLRRVGRRRAPADRIGEAIAIMRQVLAALEHAHGRGVVHRDLKPDNIMLLPRADDDEQVHVKLLDFGIAKLADDQPANAKPLTQAGVPLGTPQYMSPEQATGEATDARSDLYSCGVLLYEMLTGRLPFDSESAVQLLSMQVTAVPPSLRDVAPRAEIPEALEQIVLRALAKRREERFASAVELRRALEGISGGVGGGARAAACRYGVPRWARVLAGAAAIGCAALGVAGHHGGEQQLVAPVRQVSSSAAPEAAKAAAPKRGTPALSPRPAKRHVTAAR